jgi:hypothetical protein
MAKSNKTPSVASDRNRATLKDLGAQGERGMSEARDNLRKAAEEAQEAAQATGEEMQASVSRASDEARREGIDTMHAAGKAMRAPLDRRPADKVGQQGSEGVRQSDAAGPADGERA